MVTNETSREWVKINYIKESEDFYISNTRSLILKQWTNSFRHAIISFFLVILAGFLGWIDYPLAWFSAMQIGFVFYGLFTYCHNDQGAGELAYICCIICFTNKFGGASGFGSVMLTIIGVALAIASVIPKILYKKTLGDYAANNKKQWKSDEEEFEAWKRKYYHDGYSNYREESYNNYQGNSYQNQYDNTTNNNSYSNTQSQQKQVDPNVEKARELFKDFGTTFAELKKTYRKLAMKHHPDHGGEHDLFVAIVNEYEYLKKTKFPNEK